MKDTIYKGLFSLMFVFVLNFSIYAQKPDKETTRIPTFSELLKNKENSYYDIKGMILKYPEIYDNLSGKMRKRFGRWEYWWDTRVGDHGDFTSSNQAFWEFVENEKREKNQDPSLRFLPCTSCTDPGISSTAWESLGPNNDLGSNNIPLGSIGRMRKIWRNPNNFNNLFAGADTGGLWKTTNGGVFWNCLTDDIPLCGVADFIVDPTNSNIIYVATSMHANGPIGTGFTPENVYSQGVIKTTNGGSTWTVLNINAPIENNDFVKLVMHPTNHNIIYALAQRTVYKTVNGGTSWTNTNVPNTNPYDLNPMGTAQLREGASGFLNMVMDPLNSNTLYISGNQFFYKTTNGGSTWTNIHTKASFLNYAYSRNQITIDLRHTLSDHVLYALLEKNSVSKVVKSMDGGNTWSLVPGTPGLVKPYVSLIQLDINGNIYAGGVSIKRKDVNSTSWAIISGAHSDIRFLSFPDQNTILRCDDGGIWQSVDNGDSWSSISGNIAANQVYNIGYTESDPNRYEIGVHDGRSVSFDGTNWKNHGSGDGGKCIIDYEDDNIFYYQRSWHIYRKEGGIDHYLRLRTTQYGGPYELDPRNHETLYAGREKKINGYKKFNLVKSTDKGENWTVLNEIPNHNGKVQRITISKYNPNTIFYTDITFNFTTYPWTPNQTLWKSTDAGQSWQSMYFPLGTHDTKLTAIRIDPTNENKIWITFGNFHTGKKVYESSDGGYNWTNITSNLPNLPIQCLTFDSRNNQIYVGTDVGVYFKCIDSNYWTLCTGIPRTIISDLQINATSGELLASTYGRGIWKISLNNYCTPPSATIITSNQTWTNTRALCGDLVINNGKTLTIKGHVTMPINSEIRVKSGGQLILDGSGSCVVVKYSNLVAESGSHVIIKNGGIFQRAWDDEFDIKNGALFEALNGKIEDIRE